MPDPLTIPLDNGLLLTVTGQPTLRALLGFLRAATIHLKNQRDIQKSPLYTAGSFQGRLAGGDCAISHPGDTAGEHLSPGTWLDAVAALVDRVVALEQVREHGVADKARAASETTPARVAELLAQASATSHLEALRLSMQDRSLPH